MRPATWRDTDEQQELSAMVRAPTVRDDDYDPAVGSMPTQSVLHLPTALSDWNIVRELMSQGAEADLLLVANRSGEQRVAKIYRAGFEPRSELLQRVGGASFAHVVRLFDFGQSDGRWFELLEYVAAGSLDDLIRTEGPRLDDARVSEILQQITAAIAHLHLHAIIHRDIKPSNVLVRSRAPLDLVLTDFGIASALDKLSRRFTATHRTIAYAAPETAAGEVSRAADWWSLGILLVEMLAGHHPFAGAQPGELVNDVVIMSRIAQMSVDELAEGIEEPWRTLCRGLLRRDAKNRWGSDEIRRWIHRDPTLVIVAETAPARHGLVPFFFVGRMYESLPDIAKAFAENWQEARKSVERNHFFDWVKDELKDNEWRQFLSDLDRDCEDLDERVLRICLKLAPNSTPVFCGYELDPNGLRHLAEATLSNEPAAKVLVQLFDRQILLLAAVGLGIERCRELHTAWASAFKDYQECRRAVEAAGGPSLKTADLLALAQMLLAMLPSEDRPYIDILRSRAQEASTADARECGWFSELGDPLTAHAPVAFLIEKTAASALAQVRAERRRRAADDAARKAAMRKRVQRRNAAIAAGSAAGGAAGIGLAALLLVSADTTLLAWVLGIAGLVGGLLAAVWVTRGEAAPLGGIAFGSVVGLISGAFLGQQLTNIVQPMVHAFQPGALALVLVTIGAVIGMLVAYVRDDLPSGPFVRPEVDATGGECVHCGRYTEIGKRFCNICGDAPWH